MVGRLVLFQFPLSQQRGYDSSMALIRILIDGYSLLHGWPEPGGGVRRGIPRRPAMRWWNCCNSIRTRAGRR